MICDTCKYSLKLRLCGDGYGQIREYHSSCYLHLQPVFNRKTCKYECDYYKEEQNDRKFS